MSATRPVVSVGPMFRSVRPSNTSVVSLSPAAGVCPDPTDTNNVITPASTARNMRFICDLWGLCECRMIPTPASGVSSSDADRDQVPCGLAINRARGLNDILAWREREQAEVGAQDCGCAVDDRGHHVRRPRLAGRIQ